MKRLRLPWVVALWAALAAGCRTLPFDFSSDRKTSSDLGSTTECGDPAVLSRLAACTATRDEQACTAAGGAWTTVGLSPTKSCLCPTGQGSCACSRPEQCRAGCFAPLDGAPTSGACDDAVGHCSEFSSLAGCLCLFDSSGSAMPLCID